MFGYILLISRSIVERFSQMFVLSAASLQDAYAVFNPSSCIKLVS